MSESVLKHTLNSLLLKEKIVPLNGNGNCFYSCIIHQLWRLDPLHEQFSFLIRKLRFECSTYLRNNLNDPSLWLTLSVFSSEAEVSRSITDVPRRITSYIDSIRDGDQWANEEIFLAIIAIYKVCIVIIRSDTGSQTLYGDSSNRKLYLVYYLGQHYNSVESIEVCNYFFKYIFYKLI